MAANSRFAVAVHAATGLAHRQAQGETWTSSEQLAESIGTNPVVVRRAITALARAGIVEAQAGRGGGARLARRPRDVALADIYRAVEEGSILAHNPNPPNKTCAVSCGMKAALSPVFDAVEAAVDRTLGRTTIADMLARL